MTKNEILENIAYSIEGLNKRKQVIENLPLGEYLFLTGRELYYDNSGKYNKKEFQAFVKAISYNKDSLRFRVLASNTKNAGDPTTIHYDNIVGWRPLKIEDLPMGMSWKKKFPLYERMLKEGKLSASYKIDFVPVEELKLIRDSTVSWARYKVSCRVCGKDIYIHNPHTHTCYSCGYSFKTKENIKRFLNDMESPQGSTGFQGNTGLRGNTIQFAKIRNVCKLGGLNGYSCT